MMIIFYLVYVLYSKAEQISTTKSKNVLYISGSKTNYVTSDMNNLMIEYPSFYTVFDHCHSYMPNHKVDHEWK